MSTNDQMEITLTKFRAWFEETIQIIVAIKPGERLPVTVLSEQVAQKFGMKGSQLYPVLRFLFDDLTIQGFKRQRGAHGGWLREVPKNKE